MQFNGDFDEKLPFRFLAQFRDIATFRETFYIHIRNGSE
jgi:hypothetical protein